MVISFQNVTDSAGISLIKQSWGVAWGDFDGDGFPDIWVNNHQQKPVTLYLNQQDGTFRDVTRRVFDSREDTVGDFHGPAWFDFDNDGDQDLLQLSGGDQAFDDENPNKQNKLFVNNDGQLEDQAVALGVNYPVGRSRVPLPIDIDRDGLLDFVNTGLERNDGRGNTTIFRQKEEGGFEDIGESVGINSDVPNGTFAIAADLTGDNVSEIIYLDRVNPLTIYDTTSFPFEDISDRILPNPPADLNLIQDIAVADFNNDLKLDLYITQKGSPSTGFRRDSQSKARASLRALTKQVRGIEFDAAQGDVSFDFSGDVTGIPGFFQSKSVSAEEIFIGSTGFNPDSLDFTLDADDPNVEGIADFTLGEDLGAYIGYDSDAETWQILWSGDRRGDELDVIFESTNTLESIELINFDESFTASPDFLLINTDEGLVDLTEESGLNLPPVSGNNVVAGDFDNDMDRDIYVLATGSVKNLPNVLYENQGDGTFVAVPDAGGAAGTELGLGDAVVVADYDLDGFLDLYLTNGDVFGLKRPFLLDGPNQLFRNEGNDNNWLQVDLEGIASNRDGIGTQILATAGEVTQLQEQNSGVHDRGQNFQNVHFGLADNATVDLEIRWTNGIVQQLNNVEANQVITVREGFGKDRNDTISGGSIGDRLNGNGGNDLIDGKEDDDTINGGSGNDSLLGGAGDDFIEGQNNDDTIKGGSGNDEIAGDAGNDFIEGQEGDDVIEGNSGNDTLLGNAGDDVIDGKNDDDLILGGGGSDRLSGDNGNDFVRGQSGNDVLNGGIGNDSLMGNAGDDTLFGQNGDDTLCGGSGNDSLIGNVGADILNGFGQNDILNGGEGRDTLNGGQGNDTLVGGQDRDTLFGRSGSDSFRFLSPNNGGDTIVDFLGEDRIEIVAENFDPELNAGVLDQQQFVLGTEAQDSSDRFIYNQTTGNLFFDSDGTGENSPTLLAILANQGDLAAEDIVII